jgi:hypothetical protein
MRVNSHLLCLTLGLATYQILSVELYLIVGLRVQSGLLIQTQRWII